MKVLIWSIEHTAWWRANSNGYTLNRCEAGFYSLAKAIQICASANMFTDGGPHEAIVPIPENAEKGPQ